MCKLKDEYIGRQGSKPKEISQKAHLVNRKVNKKEFKVILHTAKRSKSKTATAELSQT